MIVEHAGYKYRSKTLKGGGRFPRWRGNDARFEIKVLSPRDTFKISIYDEDIFSDDFLGETVLSLNQLLKQRGSLEFIDMFVQEKKSGGIKIQARLVTRQEEENALVTAVNEEDPTSKFYNYLSENKSRGGVGSRQGKNSKVSTPSNNQKRYKLNSRKSPMLILSLNLSPVNSEAFAKTEYV